MYAQTVAAYEQEALIQCGIRPRTVDEYCFCLGWFHGGTATTFRAQPVTDDQVSNYVLGWVLGAWVANELRVMKIRTESI